MNAKSNIEIYITMCKMDGQWEFAVWLRKLIQQLCINLEGWGGEGDRREVQKGGGSDSKGSVYNAGDSGSSPGLGRSLEKEMAIHSSTIAWKIPFLMTSSSLPLLYFF